MNKIEDILMLAEKCGKRSQVIETAKKLREYSPSMSLYDSYEQGWDHVKSKQTLNPRMNIRSRDLIDSIWTCGCGALNAGYNKKCGTCNKVKEQSNDK